MPFDNLFPQWGSSGEPPETGKEFQSREQYSSDHVNYLWNGVRVMFDRVKEELAHHGGQHHAGADDGIEVDNLASMNGAEGEILHAGNVSAFWSQDDSPVNRLRSASYRNEAISWSSPLEPLAEGPYSAYKIHVFGLGFGEDTDLYMDINDHNRDDNLTDKYQAVHQEGANHTNDTYPRIPIVTNVSAQIHAEITINAISQLGQVTADVTGKPEHKKLVNAVGLSDPYVGIPENIRFYVVNRSGEMNWLNYTIYGVKDRRYWGRTLYHPNGDLNSENTMESEFNINEATSSATRHVKSDSADERDRQRRS